MSQHQDNGLDQALALTGDGVFATTAEGKIVLWNRAAEKALGYTARDTIGRSCCDLFMGRDGSGNRLCYRGCHVSSLVKMGEPIQCFDMQTRTKARRPVWLNISVLVTSNDHGEPLTIHLFRDTTATKALLSLVQERLETPAAPESPSELTRRELEILRLMAAGDDTRTISGRLHVSPATVRNHVQNILAKLNVHSRLQAVAYATSHRMLENRSSGSP
jgi:PAS domain S-box-containing protein